LVTFSTIKKAYINVNKKWAKTMLGDLFTNLSGHPAHECFTLGRCERGGLGLFSITCFGSMFPQSDGYLQFR
jgi:hypothetical protein